MVTTLCAPFCRTQHTRRLDDRLDDVRPQRPGASNNNDDDRSDNLFDQYFADHDDHSGYDHDDHGAINDDGRPNDDHSGYDHDELHDDIDHHDDEHHDDEHHDDEHHDDDRSEEDGDRVAD